MNRKNVAGALREAAAWALDGDSPTIRGAMARADDGLMVAPNDPRACQWCILGRAAHLLGVNDQELVGIERDLTFTLDGIVGLFDNYRDADAARAMIAAAESVEALSC